MNYNRVFLGGRLTHQPTVRTLPNGNTVCDFRIAVNRTWKDGEGVKHDEACFIDAAAWNQKASLVADYFEKGSTIFVEGRLKHDVFETKAKEVRSKHSIVVDQVVFVGMARPRMSESSSDSSSEPSSEPSTERAAAPQQTAGDAAPVTSVPNLEKEFEAEKMFDSADPPSDPGSVVARRQRERERGLQVAGAATSVPVTSDTPY